MKRPPVKRKRCARCEALREKAARLLKRVTS